MGLPFASGHVLALRRFPASSIGPGYTSVWHRDPEGNWVFYSDVDPHLSCSRFFGNALARSERSAISMTWADPRRLTIAVSAAELTWEVRLAETPATRLLNGIAAALPARALAPAGRCWPRWREWPVRRSARGDSGSLAARPTGSDSGLPREGCG